MFVRIPLSGTLLLASIAGYTRAQPAVPQPEAASRNRIHNTRGYKALCKRAKTADDFKALSAWCADQSAVCRRKVAQLEAELKEYNASSPRPGPKYPPRDQTLRDLIAHYRLLSAKWQESAENYMGRLAKLESASTNR